MPPPPPAPLISVLLPVRDGGPLLAAALDSILAQQGPDFELLAVDDGSRDGSAALLAEFAARYPALRLLRGEGRGIARALNVGLAQARGRYIARMDADDIALPGRLAAQVRYLESHPGVGVLGTQALGIDLQGRPLRPVRVPVGRKSVRAALSESAPLIHPTVMMVRELLVRVGGYRPGFDAAEDYDLWLRLAERTELDNLPQTFLHYRRHPGQQTRRRALRQARLSALALFAHECREQGRPDPFASGSPLSDWKRVLIQQGAGSLNRVRQLTAASLADNGGTLSPLGERYFHLACRLSPGLGDAGRLRRRLTLAAVRHQLQLFRCGRRRAALLAALGDLWRWRGATLEAYWRQARVLLPRSGAGDER